MKKILIQFAHPARSRSKMNNALRAAIEGLENVTLNDLYANYPDFLIDVAKEQKLCEQHDIIIFQHPFYWYSTPAIMKEWLDLVLQYDWAYGTHGTALQNKTSLQAITGGGDDDAYRPEGYNRFTLQQLTTPYQATAHLCGMDWLPPFAVFGIHRGVDQETIDLHANSYRKYITALRDDTLDISLVKEQHHLNSEELFTL